MATKYKIPKNTTLNLTRAQWLAIKGILENFVGDNDAPFCGFHASQVLDGMMGGYSGLAFDGFGKYKEYTEWYKTHSECHDCQNYFKIPELIHTDEDDLYDESDLCPKCYKDFAKNKESA